MPMGNQSTELPRGSPGSPGGRRRKQKSALRLMNLKSFQFKSYSFHSTERLIHFIPLSISLVSCVSHCPWV